MTLVFNTISPPQAQQCFIVSIEIPDKIVFSQTECIKLCISATSRVSHNDNNQELREYSRDDATQLHSIISIERIK